jgi:3-oxoacyl-[acyl-carrier protein] reductase
MTLLKKFCSLDDVSNAVLFLASNEQNYITGEVINITGGAYLG